MKLLGLLTILFMWILSALGMIYSFIAGIWQYKPFNISYQNTKIFMSSFVVFIIAWFIAYLIKEWDKV